MLKSTSPGLGPDIPAVEAVAGRGGWELGAHPAPGPSPGRPSWPSPPAGRRRGGAREGPAPAHAQCARSHRTHPPCSSSGARQRAAAAFSPARAAEPAGFHLRRAGVQATPPRGVPRELKTEGAAAARWPLALSWKGTARRGSVELGAAFVSITVPSPKPQTARAYSGHSINAY